MSDASVLDVLYGGTYFFAPPIQTDDEIVTILPLDAQRSDPSLRMVMVSTRSVAGLGCDVARMLFDFGLHILRSSITRDGEYCLFLFVVNISRGMKPQWSVLAQKLRDLCPCDLEMHTAMCHRYVTPLSAPGQEYRIQVTCTDKAGLLHTLVETLWAVELQLLKYDAHGARRSAGGHPLGRPAPPRVTLGFTVQDMSCPSLTPAREADIVDALHAAGGAADAVVAVSLLADAAEPGQGSAPEAKPTRSTQQRLNRTVSPRMHIYSANCPAEQNGHLLPQHDGRAAFVSKGWDETEGDEISLTLDRLPTHACTVVNIYCLDRKGLLYDILRTAHMLGVVIQCATIDVRTSAKADVQLYLKDSFGNAFVDDRLLTVLLHKLRQAVQLPLCVAVCPGAQAGEWDAWVFSPYDSGLRGRPRVTFDVTVRMHQIGVQIATANVNMVSNIKDAGLPQQSASQLARVLSTSFQNVLPSLPSTPGSRGDSQSQLLSQRSSCARTAAGLLDRMQSFQKVSAPGLVTCLEGDDADGEESTSDDAARGNVSAPGKLSSSPGGGPGGAPGGSLANGGGLAGGAAGNSLANGSCASAQSRPALQHAGSGAASAHLSGAPSTHLRELRPAGNALGQGGLDALCDTLAKACDADGSSSLGGPGVARSGSCVARASSGVRPGGLTPSGSGKSRASQLGEAALTHLAPILTSRTDQSPFDDGKSPWARDSGGSNVGPSALIKSVTFRESLDSNCSESARGESARGEPAHMPLTTVWAALSQQLSLAYPQDLVYMDQQNGCKPMEMHHFELRDPGQVLPCDGSQELTRHIRSALLGHVSRAAV